MATRKRGPAGPLSLSAAEVSALSWISEQYAARLDQLARWLRRSPRSAQRYIHGLREKGLAEARPLLHGESSWVWLTERGARLAGGGFRPWRPRVGRLAHVAAVNEVRLQLREEMPEAIWICERAVARWLQAEEPRPDGVLLDGDRDVTVEVELVAKSRARLTTRLEKLCHSYDAVLYYCAPGTLRQLRTMQSREHWPGLEIRHLPVSQDQPAQPADRS